MSPTEWTGIGLGWLRALVGGLGGGFGVAGRREWRVPCVDVAVRL